jgi:hypothetical protein
MAPMSTESNWPGTAGGSGLERAIVLQLLRDDREQRWSLADLRSELDADATTLSAALQALSGEGVLSVSAQEVWASPAARRLEQLALISI